MYKSQETLFFSLKFPVKQGETRQMKFQQIFPLVLVTPRDHDSGKKKAAIYNRMYSKVSGVDNTECDRDNTRINQIQEVL